MILSMTKTCFRCNQTKLISDFYKRKRGSLDGYRNDCKVCVLRICKARYEENKEQIAERQGIYYQNHKDERSEYNKQYRLRNKERLQRFEAGRRKWKREYNRRYYMQNKKKENKRSDEYRRENADRVLERNRRRYAMKKGAEGSHTIDEFTMLCEWSDWRCLACGISHEEYPLTEDHIIPLSRNGSDCLSNIQPLCFSCNCSKKDKAIDYRGWLWVMC